MNKLVSDGSVKKINYPVLYESGITPPLCEVSAPEPDAGGKRIVAYVYKSSRSTVFGKRQRSTVLTLIYW